MTESTKDTSKKNQFKTQLTKKDIIETFIFSNFQQASFNYERIHALAFCVDMIPTIKRVYKNKTDQVAALKRHLTFFNTTPAMVGPILGVTMALEEGKASGENIDAGTINSFKVGLMGPLAGVGDPIMWGTLRPILAALGASLALTGSWLGPIVFFVAFNTVRLAFKWYGLKLGLSRGLALVQDMSGNLLQKITEGATVLGLFIMGVLVTKWTTIDVPIIISKTTTGGKTTVTTFQNILDQLCPGLLALGLTLLSMYLLRKKVNPIILIFGLFGLGILGYGLGWLK
ncbi:PTS system sorbose transporter subunit IID [Agrilactobacillus composti DSM 18527 = JCM 14202]|uniref:PTS system sorbose transporter subunit IID n=1 Tax=Agrilactobacillus composti DSM 18527 = JCM 14202 TaxID=1423734 RepID=A0A0R1Y135_9LACO|nr:mannose/fructose/sorbose PTS transporter subunit IID [Agrilactobacillus composti]KRM35493.1 PTS system sorbose transporter subunit IID [Agrilactobacillus composti DSM 18527 = JCM 14202]